MTTYTAYQKTFYADTKKTVLAVLLKADCPFSFVASGKVRNEKERSHITLNATNFA